MTDQEKVKELQGKILRSGYNEPCGWTVRDAIDALEILTRLLRMR